MKKLFQIKLIGLLVVISIISCQDPLPLEDSQLELESSSPVQLSSRTTEAEEGSDTYGFGPQIVLGEELVSAYEVDNMIEAAQSLYPELTHDEVTSLIATTHLHIKIMVQDTAEHDALGADTTIDLYPYPLNYELESDGNWYQEWEEGEFSEGEYPSMYSVVNVEKDLSEFTYEILDYAHIADQAQNLPETYFEQVDWDMLEDEAWNLADEKNGKDTYQERRSKFQPRGQILVDEAVRPPPSFALQIRQPVGVDGIKVRARRGLKLSTTHTNSKGSFSMSSRFRGKVRYSIEFESYNFKIVNAFGFSINYTGPKTTDAWTHTFTWAGEEDWGCATLVNATGHFDRMAKSHGLAMPSLRNIKIRPRFTDGRSNAIGMIRHFFPFIGSLYKRADVRLYMRFGSQARKGTDNLYQLVNHEIAHVSHAEDSPLHFVGYGGAMLGESFATGIEWQFTRLSPYSWQIDGFQDASRTDIIGNDNNDYKYSPMCIDLYDDTNQFVLSGGSDEFADDRIKISWSKIQDALGGSYGLSNFETRLVNRAGTNPIHTNFLISYYEDIQDNH